ncbi:hypothetical protein AHAS_Ahas11G0061800 [Arachis hypogaea]
MICFSVHAYLVNNLGITVKSGRRNSWRCGRLVLTSARLSYSVLGSTLHTWFLKR